MGQIFQPNFTSDSSHYQIQFNWQWSAHACARPPPDFDLPIICYTAGPVITGDHQDNFTYLGGTFGTHLDAFAKCCPSNKNYTNIYKGEAECRTLSCFTPEQGLAEGFDNCVKDVVKSELADLFQNDASNPAANYSGRCEWIDYGVLKKGVQKTSGGVPKAQATWAIWMAVSWSLALSVLSQAL